MAIRYDEGLMDEIRRTVKNYQDKRRRVIQKGGELIPNPAYVANFLTDYTNRRQLIRDLKKLQRYSIRGAERVVDLESGQRITEYELGELKRLVTTAKRNITIELNKAPEFKTMQPMTQGYYENLKLRYQYLSRPIGSLTPRQFLTYERIAHGEGELDKKRQTFYNNIQNMIDELTYGVPKGIANKLRKAINRLPMAKLTELVQKDPYLGAIIDWYEIIKAGGQVASFQVALEDLIDYINAL